MSSSEEEDILSINASDLGDPPTLSPQYKEPVEVLTCVVTKIDINWPAKMREAFD